MIDGSELATNVTDRITSLAKGIFGAFPVVGPLAAEIIGNIIPNQRADRIVRFVQKLPKGMDFSKITTYRIKKVEAELNARPRKTLGYRTPHEVMRE